MIASNFEQKGVNYEHLYKISFKSNVKEMAEEIRETAEI